MKEESPRESGLPPGQRAYDSFFRFGLLHFAVRFPNDPGRMGFAVRGDIESPLTINAELSGLRRVEQVSDFHCVTTWSYCQLHWSGHLFSDFYHQLVVPLARPEPGARLVVLRGEDGYAATMLLDDLLAADVMLADRLDGASLGIEHGAPLRLIAPAHYGYKNVKHIVAIEFWRDARNFQFARPYPALMHHPRARVALEERGIGVPTPVLRFVYRLAIPATRWFFRISQERHQRRRRAP